MIAWMSFAVAATAVPPMNTKKPYLLANANITPTFRGEYFGASRTEELVTSLLQFASSLTVASDSPTVQRCMGHHKPQDTATLIGTQTPFPSPRRFVPALLARWRALFWPSGTKSRCLTLSCFSGDGDHWIRGEYCPTDCQRR